MITIKIIYIFFCRETEHIIRVFLEAFSDAVHKKNVTYSQYKERKLNKVNLVRSDLV